MLSFYSDLSMVYKEKNNLQDQGLFRVDLQLGYRFQKVKHKGLVVVFVIIFAFILSIPFSLLSFDRSCLFCKARNNSLKNTTMSLIEQNIGGMINAYLLPPPPLLHSHHHLPHPV